MTEPLQASALQTAEAERSGSLPVFRVPEKVYVGLLILLLAAIGWFYGRIVETEILGFTHDDGVYAIVSKALALGKGFTLLHVVGQPAQIKYPILYPLLMAPVWWLVPKFPENLSLLTAVTIAFTLGACGVMYFYLRQCQRFPGWLSLLTIALVTTNFFFMYFYSMIMSEAPYLFFSLLTLWVFHRASAGGTQAPSSRSILLLALLSVLTFHTRIPGLALMAAIGLWLLFHRYWKKALAYGGLCFLLGPLPWAVWTRTHTPAVTDLNYPLVNAYSNYGLELFHNIQHGNYLRALQADFTSFMNRLLEDMFPLIPNFLKIYPSLKAFPDAILWHEIILFSCKLLLLGYFLLQLVGTLRKSFEGARFHPAAFSVPGLYLVVYSVMILLWTYDDQMARFLSVMTPLLWLFFFKPMVGSLALSADGNKRRATGMVALMLAASLLALWPTANSYRILSLSRGQHWVESGKYKWLWGEYKHAFAWINQNLPKDASLAVGSDVVFSLYTSKNDVNRPTLYVFYASLQRKNGVYTADSVARLMKSLDHYKLQYLVAEPHMQFRTLHAPMNAVVKALLKKYPQRFKLKYASPRQTIGIYRILPPDGQ